MSKESLFKNKYKLTDEVLKEFVKTSTKGTRIVGLFVVVMALFFAYTEMQRSSITLAISLVAISLASLIYSIILPTITFRNIKKKDEVNKEINKEVLVDINYNNLILNVEEREEKLAYSDIISILESKDYFYLMINKDKGVILSKDGFVDGTSDEFRKFIQSKFVRPKSTGG